MSNITWRADGGIQPAPSPPPHRLTMFFPPPTPFFLLSNSPPPMYHAALATIPPPPLGMFFALPPPAQVVVDVETVVTKEVDVEISTKTKKKPSEPKKEKKEKKKEKKKAAAAPAAPPAHDRTPGTAYIFPKHHTTIFVIKDVKVWEDGYDKNFRYKSFNVGTSMVVGDLIEKLAGKEGDEVKGWAVTEVIEKGDGVFCKDVTVDHGGDLAKKDLAAMGWNKSRNGCRPPVWLVLHKNE